METHSLINAPCHYHLYCYDRAPWTIILFLSPTFPLPSYYTMDTLPPLLVIALSWTYLLISRLGQDALRTVHCLPYLLTCLTLAPTVLPTRASVPADVHLLCPLCARISSPLPYVSLHLLCTLPDPLTCVTPCPLYALS